MNSNISRSWYCNQIFPKNSFYYNTYGVSLFLGGILPLWRGYRKRILSLLDRVSQFLGGGLIKGYSQCNLSLPNRVNLFLGGGHTHLQGVHSAYSKPHRQNESIFGWGVIPICRGYTQHILSLIDRMSLFLGGGLTNLQGVHSAYSKPHRQNEFIFGWGSYPSAGGTLNIF